MNVLVAGIVVTQPTAAPPAQFQVCDASGCRIVRTSSPYVVAGESTTAQAFPSGTFQRERPVGPIRRIIKRLLGR